MISRLADLDDVDALIILYQYHYDGTWSAPVYVLTGNISNWQGAAVTLVRWYATRIPTGQRREMSAFVEQLEYDNVLNLRSRLAGYFFMCIICSTNLGLGPYDIKIALPIP